MPICKPRRYVYNKGFHFVCLRDAFYLGNDNDTSRNPLPFSDEIVFAAMFVPSQENASD